MYLHDEDAIVECSIGKAGNKSYELFINFVRKQLFKKVFYVVDHITKFKPKIVNGV